MLPFSTAPDLFTVGQVSMPRYGCLTVQEAIAFNDLLTEQADLLEPDSPVEAMDFFIPVLATLILISRHKPSWSMQTVKRFFSPDELEAIANFALGERRHWKDPEAIAEPPRSSKPPDWAEIYWLLQLYFPQEQRFNAEQFASCPIILIEQAIAASSRLELEPRSHRAAVPVSLLGCYTLAGQGVESFEPSHFNPFEKILNQQEALQEVDSAIARTLIELVDTGQVPSWAIPLIPLGKMRLAAKA